MKNGIYEKIVDHITENQEKFYRLAYSYVQNKEDALDVVQNAICQALDHYETVKNENAVRTWFYRILVNESLLFLRQRKREVLAGDEKPMEIPYYERRYDSSGEEIYEQINTRLPYGVREHGQIPDAALYLELRKNVFII